MDKLNTYHIIVFNFLFLISLNGNSQEKREIQFYENNNFMKSEKLNDKNTNINNYLLGLINKGYLLSTIDSIINNDTTLKVFVNKGEEIQNPLVNIIIPENAAVISSDIFNKTEINFHPGTFSKKISNWLQMMNDIGYPFSKFTFTNSSIEKNEIQVVCKLITGPFVSVDSIYNANSTKKETRLISNVINIKKNEPFNLTKIQEISNQINRINYLQENKPPAYEFIENKVKIYTYIESKTINNINGMIGLQPSNDGSVQLTGNLSMNIQNALNRGEKIYLNWRRMFNASQNLISSFNIPYLFNSKIQIGGHLDMIKKDSSFFNIKAKTNLDYILESNQTIGVLIDLNGSTNLLQDNYNSTSIKNFGFSLFKNKLNNRLNPTSGYLLNTEILAGMKNSYIQENNEEVEISSPNYFGKVTYQHFLKVSKRSATKIKIDGLTNINDYLFENEMTRIGGYKNLRGFDEESIWVSSYLLATVELIYQLDLESNLFLFSDLAWGEQKTSYSYSKNKFNSFGIGTNLSLPNGFLTIVYGLGRELGQPFILKTGKIHFGFTSFF